MNTNSRTAIMAAIVSEYPSQTTAVANSLCLVFFVVLPVYDPLMRGEMA